MINQISNKVIKCFLILLDDTSKQVFANIVKKCIKYSAEKVVLNHVLCRAKGFNKTVACQFMLLKTPQQLVPASSMASLKNFLYDSFMKKSGVDAAKFWALSQRRTTLWTVNSAMHWFSLIVLNFDNKCNLARLNFSPVLTLKRSPLKFLHQRSFLI